MAIVKEFLPGESLPEIVSHEEPGSDSERNAIEQARQIIVNAYNSLKQHGLILVDTKSNDFIINTKPGDRIELVAEHMPAVRICDPTFMGFASEAFEFYISQET